jgi:hypothetical protein
VAEERASLPRHFDPRAVREVRQTHPYGYRSGEWAKVLTIVESHGRDCWLVLFEDGNTDWWPITDDVAGYEVLLDPDRRETNDA